MAKERLIEEDKVIKITILVEKVLSDSTILPLNSPNPIGPTAFGPSKIGFVDLFIKPIMEMKLNLYISTAFLKANLY